MDDNASKNSENSDIHVVADDEYEVSDVCELKTTEDFKTQMDNVFNFLASHKYPSGLDKNGKRILRRKSKQYQIIDGLLHYVKKGKVLRVITDEDEQARIVLACHEGLGYSLESKSLGGHFGRDKTVSKVTRRYVWPRIIQHVAELVHRCDVCQRVNRKFNKAPAVLHSVPVPLEAWAQIGVDIVSLPKTKDGYSYIGNYHNCVRATQYTMLFPI